MNEDDTFAVFTKLLVTTTTFRNQAKEITDHIKKKNALLRRIIEGRAQWREDLKLKQPDRKMGLQ